MAKVVKYYLSGILLIFTFLAQSQNEAKKWYFGYGTGLDFSTVPVSTIAASSMSTQEGCASISDASGNLLFYTNGVTVWDKTHAVMANGNGLLGSTLSSQSSLILQQPGSIVNYYVFTNVGFNVSNVPNVNYSVIDISLSTGNGSVVTKNAVLSSDQNTEVLTATRHCNGVDWWIVTHIRASNVYLSYLLTATGISPAFVVSPAGPSILGGNSQMKISPNGKKIALNFNGVVYLGDFDASTGSVTAVSVIQNSSAGYGCEFSPDASKLYATAANGVYQYDLCQSSNAAIAASAVLVHSQNASFGSMQLAPDGKIYQSYNAFTTGINVINSPNSLGLTCGFTTGAFSFIPKLVHAGLPNYPGCLFYQKPTQSPYFYQVSSSFGCYGAYFNASLLASSCAAISNTLAMLVWDFDDPLSGINNLSYTTNPIHHFSGNGTYNVRLILHYVCGFPSDTISQLITINDNCLAYNSNSITCASPGSATITSAVGNGPFTYTWLPGMQTGTIANNLSPGNHTVVVTDNYSNYTYSVPINFPSLTAYSSSVAVTGSVSCFGGNNGSAAISNVSGGSGFQNYYWTNGTTTITGQSPANLSAGSWTAMTIDSITACQASSVITILQPPPLQLNLSVNSPTACAGSSLIVSASNSGGLFNSGFTYTWTNGPASSSMVVSAASAGTAVYTVSSTDGNNCLATNTIAVNYIQNPVISVSTISICPSSFGTLLASGANTYTWTSPAVSASVGAAFSDNPATATQYTVAGEAMGCVSVATASILLYPSPVPLLQASTPVCETGSLVLSASGGTSCAWSGPQAFSSNTYSNVITNLNAVHSGIYSATVTSVNGCTASSGLNIVVSPTPAISALGSTVCTSQTLQLSANAAAGSSYVWTGPMGFFSSQQNPAINSPVINRTGMYTVVVTAASGCKSQTSVFAQVVNPPVVSVSQTSGSLCAQNFNGSVNTINITGNGATSYALQLPAGIAASSFTGAYSSVYATAPYANTVTAVSATLVGFNAYCSAIAPFTFSVIPNPVISLSSSTPAICAGNSYTMTVNGASSYSWQSLGLNYSTNSIGSVIVVSPASNTVYSVYGSNSGCYSNTQSLTAIVYALPTITLSAKTQSICYGSQTTLTVQGTGTSYQWSPTMGLSSNTGSNVICNTLSNSVYSIVASANNCTSMATASVNVWALPSPSVISKTHNVCFNDSIVLFGTGGKFYHWVGPANTPYSGRRLALKASSPAYGGQYQLLVTDSNGCSASATTTVQLQALPGGLLVNYRESGCVPFCNNFRFESGTNNPVTASWRVNETTYNGLQFSSCFTQAGTYTVSGTIVDKNSGCKNNIQQVLKANATPTADFNYVPLHPVETIDNVTFTSLKSSGKALQYYWYFGDTKNSTAVGAEAGYTYAQAGDYPVALVVEDQNRCRDTLVKYIKVESDFALYVPNAFSPNSDTRNDGFKAVTRSVKFFQLKIYNRWGQEVFFAKDSETFWDGTFRGEACKQDNYTWVIELTTSAGQRVSKTGSVLLLRQ